MFYQPTSADGLVYSMLIYGNFSFHKLLIDGVEEYLRLCICPLRSGIRIFNALTAVMSGTLSKVLEREKYFLFEQNSPFY